MHFGVNQWQEYERGITYTSPLLLGSTAIWSSQLIDGDGRQAIFTSNNNQIDNKIFPVNYSELDAQSAAKRDLYAWWDMDITPQTFPAYSYVTNSHTNKTNTLILSGLYTSSLENVIESKLPAYNFVSNTSEGRENSLPFGGFPATDRYGR